MDKYLNPQTARYLWGKIQQSMKEKGLPTGGTDGQVLRKTGEQGATWTDSQELWVFPRSGDSYTLPNGKTFDELWEKCKNGISPLVQAEGIPYIHPFAYTKEVESVRTLSFMAFIPDEEGTTGQYSVIMVVDLGTRVQVAYGITKVPWGIPTGGKTGQVLTKVQEDDYAMEWQDIPSDDPKPVILTLTKKSGNGEGVGEYAPDGWTIAQLWEYFDDPKSVIIIREPDINNLFTFYYRAEDQCEFRTGPISVSGGLAYYQIIIKKNPESYTGAYWFLIHELPGGGSKGQILAKASNSNMDFAWQNPSDVSVVYQLTRNEDGTFSPPEGVTFEEFWSNASDKGKFCSLRTDSNSQTFFCHDLYLDRKEVSYRSDLVEVSDGAAVNKIDVTEQTWNDKKIVLSYTWFVRGIPSGGKKGQVLAKKSDSSQDVEWADASGGLGYERIMNKIGTIGKGAHSFTRTVNLQPGDILVIDLMRENLFWYQNFYLITSDGMEQQIICPAFGNTGATIFNRISVSNTGITLNADWWSGYEYTGVLGQSLCTGMRVYYLGKG